MARRGGLGDILVEERLIGREQLDQAKRAAGRLGTPLVGVLLDQGLVSEGSLVEALCRQLHLDVYDPSHTLVDLDAVREVPFEEADRYRLLPLQTLQHGNQRVLRVAMADPLDTQAIEDIEFSTGCIVEPLIARPSQLAEAIRSNYRGIVTKIIQRPRGGDPELTPVAPVTSRRRRRPFGGDLDEAALRTRPIISPQHVATPAQKVDAVVSMLIQKGVFTRDEYEERLSELANQGSEEVP
jgi:MshEN domain